MARRDGLVPGRLPGSYYAAPGACGSPVSGATYYYGRSDGSLIRLSFGVDPELHRVYVTQIDNAVSVIDPRTNQVIKQIRDVAHTPVGIAVDPLFHTVYVGDRGNDSEDHEGGKHEDSADLADGTMARSWTSTRQRH